MYYIDHDLTKVLCQILFIKFVLSLMDFYISPDDNRTLILTYGLIHNGATSLMQTEYILILFTTKNHFQTWNKLCFSMFFFSFVCCCIYCTPVDRFSVSCLCSFGSTLCVSVVCSQDYCSLSLLLSVCQYSVASGLLCVSVRCVARTTVRRRLCWCLFDSTL